MVKTLSPQAKAAQQARTRESQVSATQAAAKSPSNIDTSTSISGGGLGKGGFGPAQHKVELEENMGIAIGDNVSSGPQKVEPVYTPAGTSQPTRPPARTIRIGDDTGLQVKRDIPSLKSNIEKRRQDIAKEKAEQARLAKEIKELEKQESEIYVPPPKAIDRRGRFTIYSYGEQESAKSQRAAIAFEREDRIKQFDAKQERITLFEKQVLFLESEKKQVTQEEFEATTANVSEQDGPRRKPKLPAPPSPPIITKQFGQVMTSKELKEQGMGEIIGETRQAGPIPQSNLYGMTTKKETKGTIIKTIIGPPTREDTYGLYTPRESKTDAPPNIEKTYGLPTTAAASILGAKTVMQNVQRESPAKRGPFQNVLDFGEGVKSGLVRTGVTLFGTAPAAVVEIIRTRDPKAGERVAQKHAEQLDNIVGPSSFGAHLEGKPSGKSFAYDLGSYIGEFGPAFAGLKGRGGGAPKTKPATTKAPIVDTPAPPKSGGKYRNQNMMRESLPSDLLDKDTATPFGKQTINLGSGQGKLPKGYKPEPHGTLNKPVKESLSYDPKDTIPTKTKGGIDYKELMGKDTAQFGFTNKKISLGTGSTKAARGKASAKGFTEQSIDLGFGQAAKGGGHRVDTRKIHREQGYQGLARTLRQRGPMESTNISLGKGIVYRVSKGGKGGRVPKGPRKPKGGGAGSYKEVDLGKGLKQLFKQPTKTKKAKTITDDLKTFNVKKIGLGTGTTKTARGKTDFIKSTIGLGSARVKRHRKGFGATAIGLGSSRVGVATGQDKGQLDDLIGIHGKKAKRKSKFGIKTIPRLATGEKQKQRYKGGVAVISIEQPRQKQKQRFRFVVTQPQRTRQRQANPPRQKQGIASIEILPPPTKQKQTFDTPPRPRGQRTRGGGIPFGFGGGFDDDWRGKKRKGKRQLVTFNINPNQVLATFPEASTYRTGTAGRKYFARKESAFARKQARSKNLLTRIGI